MNNETLNRLNAFVADYKKESEDKDAIIKQQNQTLLHISAELEAIKQYDPLDRVLVSCSIENISTIIKGETKLLIDDACVGCAGPCKVVDVAANLQEELDSTIGQLGDSRKRCDYLSTEIERRESEIYDLKKDLPNNFWAAVAEKDSMIRRQSKVIEDFKTIETRETDRLNKTIEDLRQQNVDKDIAIMQKDLTLVCMATEIKGYKATIEELKDQNIEDLKELYDFHEGGLEWFKDVISERDITIDGLKAELIGIKADRTSIKSDRDIMFQNHRNTIAKLREDIRGLEVELSASKDDSTVLMKVVDEVKEWGDTTSDPSSYTRRANAVTLDRIAFIIEDYLDAPEGPPETPINEPQEITIAVAFLELP